MASNSEENPTLLCFICEKNLEEEELTLATENGLPGLQQLTKDTGDDLLQERLNATTIIYYHQSCKTQIFNTGERQKRKRNAQPSKNEDSRKKRQRPNVGQKVFLPYKNKCILCNDLVSLYKNNRSQAKKTYSKPDNVTGPGLMEQFLKTADNRLALDSNDTWAISVKGRLSGINDIVSEEALLHKKCSTKFLNFRNA